MITLTQPVQDEHPELAEPLEAIQRAAETVVEASLPDLRAQIDATYAFMVGQFIPNVQAQEQATGTRLARKLLALRERLVYSEFGPAEQCALRSVLYDLNKLVEVHAFKGGIIPTAQIPAGAQMPSPTPSDTATTSQGSYYLGWKLCQSQGSAAAPGAEDRPEIKPQTATKP
jgi:hypothetical protein